MKKLTSYLSLLALFIATSCACSSPKTKGLALGHQNAAITLTTGSNNDVAIGARSGNVTTVVKLTANASGSTLSGMSSSLVEDGDLFIVRNESASGSLTITNEDTASVAANRFLTANAVSLVLPPKASALVEYDSTAVRWMASEALTSPTFTGATTFASTTAFTGAATFSGDAIHASTGHIKATGTAPTISSCGTSPSAVTGSDIAGTYTTGSAATTCTVTFATTFTTAPTCVVSTQASATQPTYTVSATAITVSVDIASTAYSYICIGH